jgi:hypothetical protein
MRKKHFAICLGIVVSIVLLAVFVPSCGATTGTIAVKATLGGNPWPTEGTGAVSYGLSQAQGAKVYGTEVPYTFKVATGEWTCIWVSGGPAGAHWTNTTPAVTQTLSKGGTINFTLNFEPG